MKFGDWKNVVNSAHLQLEHVRPVERRYQIALLILDGCPLSDAATIAETCQLVNEALPSARADAHGYNVCMLATQKGFVSCASAIRLFAENIDDFDSRRYKAIFVGGGNGIHDRRVIDWLKRAGDDVELIAISPDAHAMLAATGLLTHDAQAESPRLPDERMNGAAKAVRSAQPDAKLAHGEHALRRLLAMVERDFGALARIRSEMLRANRSLTHGNLVPAAPQKATALSERIEAAVLWIKSNHAGSVSVSELARRVSMSERNFLRRFKSEIGQTPHEYLARVRLENAQLLLVQTDLPIDKIARRCGLLNGDHLRKYFVKYLSVTPVEYRMLARDRVVTGGVLNGIKSEM